MNTRSLRSHLRVALLSGAAVLCVGSYAVADTIETVVVTGTRIPKPETDFSNPVVTTGAADLKKQGVTDLGDFLKQVPALAGSSGNFQTSGYNTPAANDASSLGGLDLLNLRNLGYIRTLVLIDSHRSVSESTGSAAVDANTIPITLIDRVDVVTGGASAVYGADGVSGVVNFILKHNLEGIHASFQAGTSNDGGGSSTLAAVSVGHNLDDDKGNVTLTLEHGYQDPLYFTERSFSRVGAQQFLVTNPADPTDDPLIPDNIYTSDVQFVFSARSGAIDTDLDPDLTPDHLGNGGVYHHGIDVGGGSEIGSSGMPYAEDLQGDFQPLNRRIVGQVGAHYDFSDAFKINAQFKYANIDSSSRSTAPFDDIILISSDNPFLPANIAALMNANGTGLGVLAEDYLQLRNIERIKRKTYTGLFEISGNLSSPSFLDKFRYDVNYTYGQTDVDDIQVNNRISDRFLAALDAVDDGSGHPVCRSNITPGAMPPDFSLLFGPGNEFYSDTMGITPFDYPQTFAPGPSSGCVAFNPFDPNADNTAAIAFITLPTHTYGVITQHVVNGYLSADVPAWENWGMAGPLSVVAGFEYRKETSQSTPDAIEQSDNAWISGYQPVSGEFDVREVFGEVSVPIIKGDGFVKELTLDGAVRQSHYSTAGDSTSWKYGGVVSFFEGVKFRATEAFAVRAPNIGELFSPTQTLFSFPVDPCDHTNVNNGTSFRAANCAALLNPILAAAGEPPYNPLTTSVTSDQSVATRISSNPLLKPESARTFTAGIVIQPADSNFLMTIDWYRVNLTNAIEALSSTVIAAECVDLSTIVNPFCGQITRDGDPGAVFPGAIIGIDTQALNVSNFGTSGFEWNITYHAETTDWFEKDYGAFDFHLLGAYLNTLTRRPIANEAQEEHAGEEFGGEDGTPAPRWQANLDILYTLSDVSFDWNMDWYTGTLITTRQTASVQPDYVEARLFHTADRWVHNMQINWRARPEFEVYFGANNVFYQKPSIGQIGYPVDPLGRFFYVGAKIDTGFGN